MKKLVVWGDFIHQDWLLGSLFHWVQMHFVISNNFVYFFLNSLLKTV